MNELIRTVVYIHNQRVLLAQATTEKEIDCRGENIDLAMSKASRLLSLTDRDQAQAELVRQVGPSFLAVFAVI